MRAALLGACAGMALAAPAAAQDRAAECRQYLATAAPGVSAGDAPCQALATFLLAVSPRLNGAFAIAAQGAVLGARDFQSHEPQQAAAGGSLAQSDALPAVRPAGIAAGSIAAVGSDAGQDLVAALALNPALLFLGDAASEALARFTRFADLSVLFPVSGLDADSDGTVDYFGARLRMNLSGVSQGSRLWATADSLMRAWISRSGRMQAQLLRILEGAPDLGGCADALQGDPVDQAAVRATCGEAFAFEVSEADARRLRDEFARIRNAADASYFGLDLRFDFGDPTLGATAGASGAFVFGGIAFGRRLGTTSDGAASTGLRGRLGARYAALDDGGPTDLAVEGGFGFEVARRLQAQQVRLSGAVEFRFGDEDALADRLQTDFLVFRAALNVPITAANGVALAVTLPLLGDVGSVLAVNFDWGLLFPGVSGR